MPKIGKTRNVKKSCKAVCGKTKKILGNFIKNKKYLKKLNKNCNKQCVKKYTRKQKNQKGGASTGVFPGIITNLMDGISHSAMSTFNVVNGYPVDPSPLPFLAHYKPLF